MLPWSTHTYNLVPGRQTALWRLIRGKNVTIDAERAVQLYKRREHGTYRAKGARITHHVVVDSIMKAGMRVRPQC